MILITILKSSLGSDRFQHFTDEKSDPCLKIQKESVVGAELEHRDPGLLVSAGSTYTSSHSILESIENF